MTFIFRNGQPLKGLETDITKGNPFVSRISSNESSVLERELGDNGLSGERNKYLRNFRKSIVRYSSESNYLKVQEFDSQSADQENEPKVCTVFYADGDIEDLDLRALDILIRNDSWRKQVLIVQGYVPKGNNKR